MPVDKELILRLPLRGEGNEPAPDNLVMVVDKEGQTAIEVGDNEYRISSEDLQEAVGALWMFFGRLR